MAQEKNEIQESGRGLVNPADPMEMDRIQETKPSHTKTAAGETSEGGSKSNQRDDGQNASGDQGAYGDSLQAQRDDTLDSASTNRSDEDQGSSIANDSQV